MNKKVLAVLPIRSKLEMAQEIGQVIRHYHQGQITDVDRILESMKARSVHLDEQIQQDVLVFAEQIQFQEAYDEWHTITPEIQRSADRLLEDLGMNP